MHKYFNSISTVAGVVGGVFCKYLGGWDMLLKAMVFMAVMDYITGLIKGFYCKEASSEIGFKGILKKIMIFIVIATAYVMQSLLGDTILLREMVIVFFIVNEGLSLLENAAVLIPIPEKLKETLLQLRESGEDK